MDMLAIYLIGVTIGIILCFIITAVIASNRGTSAFGWCVASIFITPIITWVILLIVYDTKKQKLKKLREEKELMDQV